MSAALISVLIAKLPEIIALSKQWFSEAHPNAPVPTDEEVVQAWLLASASSVHIDDAWLASH